MSKKEEKIRQEAMEYAYHIVVTQGVDALKERVRRNSETFIPSYLEESMVADFFTKAVDASVYTELAMILYAMSEKGYTQGEVYEIVQRFCDLSDSMHWQYLALNDMITFVKETYGIDLNEFIKIAKQTDSFIDSFIETTGKRINEQRELCNVSDLNSASG